MIVVNVSALVKCLLREEGGTRSTGYIRQRKPTYTIDHALKERANAV